MLSPKLWTLLLVGLAFIFASFTYVYAADSVELAKLQRQVLGVTVQMNGNCSGTIIRSQRDQKTGEVQTLILSAGHCAIDKDADQFADVPVYQNNQIVKKERYIARVLGVFYDGDLSLFVLKDKQTYFPFVAKIAPENAPLYMGEEVWTVGYPLGMSLTITEGLFGAIETNDFAKSGSEYYRATPDIAGGNSGGALYHKNAEGDYEMLGVTTAGMTGLPFIALYTPLAKIRQYLSVAAPDVLAMAGAK